MSKSVSRGPGTLVRQVSRATRADGAAVASAAVVGVAAAVLVTRAREASYEAVADVAQGGAPITPDPARRPRPRSAGGAAAGRRARRPHVPKRRGERRRGLLPVIAMMLAGFALAVPWYLPGFTGQLDRFADSVAQAAGSVDSAGHAVYRYFVPGPVVIQDPPVLTEEPVVPSRPPVPRPSTRPGVPLTLQVPLLQIDSVVIPISGDSGALLPPSDPQEVGWWLQGPKPGSAQGTAVLTGHTVHYGGGAFDHLSFLRIGDHFTVKTDHGSIRYVIVRLHKYRTGELARIAAHLFRLAGPPQVLLVTCSGWNGHIYLENTVVTGEPLA